MKRIATTLFFALAGTFAFGQSLQFVEHGTSTAAPANYNKNVDGQVGDALDMDLKNLTSNSFTYKIRKRILTSPSGCSSLNSIHFCDAMNCYPPNGTLSATNLQIAANQTVGASSGYALKADIDPGDCCGTYVVRYTAFNTANANDSTSFTITYMVSNCTGISNSHKAFELGTASPNPVSALATLKYDFYSTPENASIKVYNMVGSLVKEIKLEGSEGKAVIDATTFSDGIYFYSLNVNDKVINTKKLVVAH